MSINWCSIVTLSIINIYKYCIQPNGWSSVSNFIKEQLYFLNNSLGNIENGLHPDGSIEVHMKLNLSRRKINQNVLLTCQSKVVLQIRGKKLSKSSLMVGLQLFSLLAATHCECSDMTDQRVVRGKRKVKLVKLVECSGSPSSVESSDLFRQMTDIFTLLL